MGALHQPELEPGPHRDLVEALHRLHREAGEPSLRAIGRKAGCSHTTVFHVLSHPRLPAWELLEVIVTALAGTPAEFRVLWLAATAEGIRHLPPPGRTIAGRRAELVVVRRHLEAGSGLLLVVGEAGLGKTTLVAAASQQVSTFVAHARGFPLLSDTPFALVADALREVWRFDEGRWMRKALAACPEFVQPSLARILFELGPPRPDGDDRFATDRLFAAVRSTLAALAALRPLALVLEDLHWADPSSRSCLEGLVLGGRGVPVVGTLETGGSAEADEWLLRVRREATLVLNLPPLTEKESRDQVRLLIGHRLGREDLDRIHGTSRGLPLFTEELVRSMAADLHPDRLDDALSRRLEALSPSARAVLAVAALADRPLPATVFQEAAAMGEAELTDGLRELVTEHFIAGPYGMSDIAVQHPLTAATMRSRLVPSEATSAHRRLAKVLADTPYASAAEVAEHWRGAQDAREELRWRVAAARTACDRLARHEEAAHWERVLQLWPEDGPAPADAGVSRPDLLLEAVHAMVDAGRAVEVRPWVEEVLALGPGVPDAHHALASHRAGQALADVDPDSALRLAGEALTAYEELGDRVGALRAMGTRSRALRGTGRYDEAVAEVATALSLSSGLGESALHREVLIEHAWLEVAAGRTLSGLHAAQAASLLPVDADPVDPFDAAWLGTRHTDLLLILCAAGDDVAEAARSGLSAIHGAGIDLFVPSTLLLCNVAEARIGEGAVSGAHRLLRPHTRDKPRQATRHVHLLRAWVDVLRGDLEAADRRLEAVTALGFKVGSHRQGLLTIQVLCDLWRGLPAQALDHVGRGVADETATSWSPYTGTLLVLAARAAADVARGDPTRHRELTDRLRTWHHQWSEDPFAPEVPHAAAPASRTTWQAELARLSGTARATHWVGAADQWDLVGRPHDAAYCRWRAAELALHDGEVALAARLLRRAHAQARGHVPLLRVIEQCRDALPRALATPAPRRAAVGLTAATTLIACEHR